MCDGLGWLTAVDYKRALLLYDEVSYLLPASPREFIDVSGGRQSIVFPALYSGADTSFRLAHYSPEEPALAAILEAAKRDAADPEFARAVGGIDRADRLYTWRVVNADGDLWSGPSEGLRPEEEVLAHAILVNKFLLAAERLRKVPITGKPHVHEMLLQKRRAAVAAVRFGLVSDRLVSALVPDADLEARTEEEIVSRVEGVPLSKTFAREVEDLVNTEVRSAVKDAVAVLLELPSRPRLDPC